MKLLKLEICELPKGQQFKSLHSGFKVEFHSLSEKGKDIMSKFRPFCFSGLNESGKSNVLEALTSIFFHLECCVAKYKPKNFEKHFRRNECKPNTFTLEYLIGQRYDKSTSYKFEKFDKITIKKEDGLEPKMYRQVYPFSEKQKPIEVSLKPRLTSLSSDAAADGKNYLPDIVIGYSSGENEILSLPFIKSRLINFDKYKEDYSKDIPFNEPETSLIYIDNTMSQAVLLDCLPFEDEKTLAPLKKELGILNLRSFRMNLNIQLCYLEKDSRKLSPILEHAREVIGKLKKCSSKM